MSIKITYGAFVLFLALLSYNKKTTNETYAIVKGTIKHQQENQILIIKESSVIDSIAIAEDGSFLHTMDVKYPQRYTFVNGKAQWNAYLENGKELTIQIDLDDVKHSLTYTGTTATVNNYLLEKADTFRSMYSEAAIKDLYLLEEESFKAEQLRQMEIFERFLSSYKNLPEAFVKKEKRDIFYQYLENLERYESFHGYFAELKDFKVSENFFADVDTLSHYNNEEDYFYSAAYRTLVERYCAAKAQQIADSLQITDKNISYLKAVSTLSNPVIKNEIAYNEIKRNITFVRDPETYYTLYKELSLDEAQEKEITKTYKELMKLAKGNPSPRFSDYENYAGGTTSLTDLKGKYVYIDVWATWCMPCRQEIPYLQQLEKEYEHKNIMFVSISIDVEKARDAWKKMIAENNMGGIQLLAPKAGKSDFIEQYMIRGIPRFILIDPQGNIVSANAPRPSEKEAVQNLFNSLAL
ncbi:TlpA disulfide reductase family protein [Olivibacter sp. XZL3]|uniref:TlpA disulfide reductase family protein n=1 Tax=Olivibacter sp. XZL3 TaxID=1735116 RepID=UPI0010650A7C|nr:TlpA disulfide reductase family protein [Olivibacter sp. XZL3]